LFGRGIEVDGHGLFAAWHEAGGLDHSIHLWERVDFYMNSE
jgi:hypothetical protein